MRLNWALLVHGCSGTRESNPPHVVPAVGPSHPEMAVLGPPAPAKSMRTVAVGAAWAHVARVSRRMYGAFAGTVRGLKGSNSSSVPGGPLTTEHTRPSGRRDMTCPLKNRRE